MELLKTSIRILMPIIFLWVTLEMVYSLWWYKCFKPVLSLNGSPANEENGEKITQLALLIVEEIEKNRGTMELSCALGTINIDKDDNRFARFTARLVGKKGFPYPFFLAWLGKAHEWVYPGTKLSVDCNSTGLASLYLAQQLISAGSKDQTILHPNDFLYIVSKTTGNKYWNSFPEEYKSRPQSDKDVLLASECPHCIALSITKVGLDNLGILELRHVLEHLSQGLTTMMPEPGHSYVELQKKIQLRILELEPFRRVEAKTLGKEDFYLFCKKENKMFAIMFGIDPVDNALLGGDKNKLANYIFKHSGQQKMWVRIGPFLVREVEPGVSVSSQASDGTVINSLVNESTLTTGSRLRVIVNGDSFNASIDSKYIHDSNTTNLGQGIRFRRDYYLAKPDHRTFSVKALIGGIAVNEHNEYIGVVANANENGQLTIVPIDIPMSLLQLSPILGQAAVTGNTVSQP